MPRSPSAIVRAAVASLGTAAAVAACQPSPATPAPPPTPARDSQLVEVGYGTQARKDVTGAISSMSGEQARRHSPATVAEMLRDRFPGVDVQPLTNGGVSIRIRGRRSLMGSNEPLFVIDGSPVLNLQGGAITGLEPADIVSIEVLKDAGSTAAYGSRGANGVILITTRKRSRD